MRTGPGRSFALHHAYLGRTSINHLAGIWTKISPINVQAQPRQNAREEEKKQKKNI